ncbi:hypothetical protein ACFSKN_10425 [Mariniflexile gromovii]|uniref:Uncharacterized protein n=1 Tax=Mariniflexile gromovii TaxID=362523 RepID=A0ABS4BYF4_9FLAO|nr:hypothetical protein [Mariniflexile gromovii]MBP0905612.1 hypothetical protein [Mariniflexile gromovii]
MKKIIKLSYFLFVSLAIVSCSKDDDDKEIFTNTVEYDGISFNVEQADIFDYGTYQGYYNYEFELEGTSSDEIPFYIYMDLYSKGTESFRTGTFEFYNSEDIEGAPDFVFAYAELRVDNGDYIEAVGGTITVTKNGDIYTISAQITLENDEVVTVSYSGEPTITIDN